MNYISEINSFYNWVMFNPLPPDAQALWHVLMQMNNRCAVKVNNEWYWRVEFSVPNQTLLSMLAFSRQQLDRMRNVLIQTGRIMYKRGKGNQSGLYSIIPFDSTLQEVELPNNSEKLWIGAKYVTQSDTQSGHNLIHKAGTNADLCNIFGTLINNKYIYNKEFGVGEYDTPTQGADCLPELDAYIGMTTDIKVEIATTMHQLFVKFANKQPTAFDIVKGFELVYSCKREEDNSVRVFIDNAKTALLGYAMQQAAYAGKFAWPYIDGILDNIRERGLATVEDCEKYDTQRRSEIGGIM